MDIDYKSGDETVLDEIQELWEELNQLHLDKSPYFKHHYISFSYQARKESLIKCAERGKLFVLIAYHDSVKIGYCVASVVEDVGEIESIYIKPDYRHFPSA